MVAQKAKGLWLRLLPLMMSKVMPVMLQRVSARIPMPDYMREQMPELMPKLMDSITPHIIGDVVSMVTQPMIPYLRRNEPEGQCQVAFLTFCSVQQKSILFPSKERAFCNPYR